MIDHVIADREEHGVLLVEVSIAVHRKVIRPRDAKAVETTGVTWFCISAVRFSNSFSELKRQMDRVVATKV